MVSSKSPPPYHFFSSKPTYFGANTFQTMRCLRRMEAAKAQARIYRKRGGQLLWRKQDKGGKQCIPLENTLGWELGSPVLVLVQLLTPVNLDQSLSHCL